MRTHMRHGTEHTARAITSERVSLPLPACAPRHVYVSLPQHLDACRSRASSASLVSVPASQDKTLLSIYRHSIVTVSCLCLHLSRVGACIYARRLLGEARAQRQTGGGSEGGRKEQRGARRRARPDFVDQVITRHLAVDVGVAFALRAQHLGHHVQPSPLGVVNDLPCPASCQAHTRVPLTCHKLQGADTLIPRHPRHPCLCDSCRKHMPVRSAAAHERAPRPACGMWHGA